MMNKVLTMRTLIIIILIQFLLLPVQAAVDTNNQVIVENITQLTFNSSGGEGLDWSPDGQKIVFCRPEDYHNSSIWIVDADGTNPRQLTSNTSFNCEPKWSHDGKMIVFSSWKESGDRILLMNNDGDHQKELNLGWSPAWTPDGMIAFIRTKDVGYELITVNTEGADERKILSKQFNIMNPKWSPDGTKIAFGGNRSGNWDIFTVNSDGSNEKQLTDDIKDEWSPSWNPDGTKIVYHKFVQKHFDENGREDYDIMVMNSDGSNKIKLNTESGFQLFPSWSPDGRKIAFLKNGDIWIMNLKSPETPAPASKSMQGFEGFLAIACTGAALLLRKR
ncbi:MAG: DPP IV N-terminal domain-containing protein [Candidatus Methanoperedens sp.]|nr:DPP IV N-terminal domain-containing protein [Candidatus Methanoperedens sp.]MCZ7404321.1 DPP IV N-terminal domain-containing protein [Candidatus Methanoperedens sp.]